MTDAFEEEINSIFDSNITEELFANDTITEGMIEKAKSMAKKAMSLGIDKVLPDEWVKFAKGLIAAAKKGPQEVADFLLSADQDKVGTIVQAADQTSIAEDLEKEEKPVMEQGGEAALAKAGEMADYLATGSYVGLAIIGLIGLYGVYKVVRAGIEIYQQTKKMEKNKARREARRRR